VTDLEQREIVCMANDAVFRVTRPASRFLFWPTLCDECLRHHSPLERATQRPEGYVVDNRRLLTVGEVDELRGRWRGRLGPKKRVTEYPQEAVLA
jgi:hypothetical protein